MLVAVQIFCKRKVSKLRPRPRPSGSTTKKELSKVVSTSGSAARGCNNNDLFRFANPFFPSCALVPPSPSLTHSACLLKFAPRRIIPALYDLWGGKLTCLVGEKQFLLPQSSHLLDARPKSGLPPCRTKRYHTPNGRLHASFCKLACVIIW